MNYTKIMDEVRLVNTVCEQTTTFTPTIPEPELRARRIAAEAGRWLTFAATRSRMTPAVLTAKALDSTAFSVAAGASHFAVPSKLVGTKAHQRALWQIVRDGYRIYDELETDTATTSGIRVSYGDVLLGDVQPKHMAWLRPLIPFGARIYLARVTGHEVDGRTLGCNVTVGGVSKAIAALTEALGTQANVASGDGAQGDGAQGDGAQGDGASGDGSASMAAAFFPVPALPSCRRATMPTGDSVSMRLGACPAPDPDDVVLYRHVDGTARATVAHIVRHSPSGIEWSYGGSGPADLALSVLAALTDENTADQLYQRFKDEIVALVPFAGTVLRAAGVREWIARQTA